MQAPWYFGAMQPTLKHQREPDEWKKNYSQMNDWYKKGAEEVYYFVFLQQRLQGLDLHEKGFINQPLVIISELFNFFVLKVFENEEHPMAVCILEICFK